MKKFLLYVFILCFLFSGKTFASEHKFAILSDVHIRLSQNADGTYKLTPTINNLQKAIAQINASNVDFVIFLGDNIDQANKESVVMFAKIANRLKKPYYVIIGNHDVAQVMKVDKKKYFQLVNRFSKNKLKKVPSLKVKEDIVLIFMDGVNQFIPGAKGYYRDNELIWLEGKLKKYKNKKIFIFQHYPLVEPYTSKSHQTTNADEYLNLLKKYDNVKAVFSGHYHADNEQTKDNIMHISIPTLQDGTYKEVDIDIKKRDNDCVIRTKILDIK